MFLTFFNPEGGQSTDPHRIAHDSISPALCVQVPLTPRREGFVGWLVRDRMLIYRVFGYAAASPKNETMYFNIATLLDRSISATMLFRRQPNLDGVLLCDVPGQADHCEGRTIHDLADWRGEKPRVS